MTTMTIVRARRRRDEEDDDYDSRSRRRKQGGNKGAMIAIIALVLALIGGLVWLLIYLFGGSSNYDKEMLAFLPKDTVGVFGGDIDAPMKMDGTR